MFQTGRGLLVEAYLIDFDGDLYGETLRVAFLERMRGEKRFESVEELVEQMQADVSRRRSAQSAESGSMLTQLSIEHRLSHQCYRCRAA